MTPAPPAGVAETPPPGGGATATAATDVLTQEVAGSAEAYRKLGEVFVSALAAIPTATLVTSLIKAPSDAGLTDWKLAAGLVLAGIALALGIWLAVWLRTPVEISTQALNQFQMSRIIGTNQDTFADLLIRIDQLEDAVADADETTRPVKERHLQAVLATLRNVHLLATADALRARVQNTKTYALAALALAAAVAAVFFLAVAPKPKPAEAKAAAPASIVTVTLSPEGAKTLGCSKMEFNALKIGGTEAEPQVVPIGGVVCKAGSYLTLTVADKQGLATKVKGADPTEAPAVTTPSATTPSTTSPPAAGSTAPSGPTSTTATSP